MTSRVGHGPPFRQDRQAWGRARAGMVALGLAMLVGSISAPAAETQLDGRAFRLPDGFTIERAAGAPMIDRPITAAFDDRGRLYVADSSGSNDNVRKQLEERPHRIVRLEDSDRDGVFDRSVVFADKMMFPEGTMWRDGSLYVAAPPSIWKLTDTDDDGVADRREEWFRGRTLTGCANDLHGPYPGPDGRIYWCKGAFARQTYPRPGKSPFSSRAAHIFRALPDGTGIEPVMTGGMDNPVDVVFTPGGERVFTTTFFIHPSGGRRDGLIHAIYGGIYGKIHEPIFEPVHKWTGPEVMPVLLDMGPAAPCGLVRYESEAFGPAYRDNLFACYFNLHKVGRHALVPSGASFTTRDDDFVSSPDLDFHPTDVIEDADGSLLIVNTGGWYKLCCPSSQLQKPDILGAIYRVRRTGATRLDDPRGQAIDWPKLAHDPLAALVDDPRPAVRDRAIGALARRGEPALPAIAARLRNHSGPRGDRGRADLVWAACRIDNPQARAVVREALEDPSPAVRQVATHAAGLWRDRQAASKLIGLLRDDSPAVARASAEALGRIGDAAAVPALLAAVREAPDRIMEHSITYALIEIEAPDATRRGLDETDPRTIRAALIALDQMEGGRIEPRRVAALLSSDRPILKEAASWIVGRHPEWAGELAGVLGDRLATRALPASDRAELARQLGRYAGSEPIARLLADRLADPASTPDVRRICLSALASSSRKPGDVPTRWIEAMSTVLDSKDPSLIAAVVTTARSLPVARGSRPAQAMADRLLRLADDAANPTTLRLDALAAIPGGLDRPTPAVLDFLLDQIDTDRPVADRTTAADVLARARLSNEQLARVAESMAGAGPVEADRLLSAFEQSTNEAVGVRLVDVLAQSPALSGLRAEAIRTRLTKYPESVRTRAQSKLYARLEAGAAQQREQLEQRLATLAAGDVRRGQIVFHSEKAACYACHAIGYRGGNVGPDLTRIGSVRSDRDLLESILFPSASLVRSFEPVAIATQDGKVYNGLIRGEDADEIRLATGPNQEVRVSRTTIEEMRPGTVSVMPAGLDRQLTPQELADLIAFLKACR